MDKRILKSTQKIKETYLKMLFKMEPCKIQVKDLCEEAGINRSTFYDRFGFLDALENEIISEEIEKTSMGNIQIDSLPKEFDGIDKSVIKTFIENFLNNKVLMRFCMATNREKYIDRIAHKQVDICASNLTLLNYYDAYFQCLGALSTIIEWVNNHRKLTIDDVVNVVYKHSIAMFS
ncbi:MAG: hypothetical protein MJZ37_07635 [Bacilli bacterium]|nr:hypothetical protein [Bacilli bacterium]